MSRSLRPAFFVLLLAFAAVAASAGPDDLFDARVPGALQPGQQQILLALENGRYTLQEGHFIDARAADPGRPFLTNTRVVELLAGPGDGTRPDGAAAAAGDAAYQRSLDRARKVAPAKVNFDGGVAHGADIRGPPASGFAAGALGAASDPAVLQAQFLQRLVFKGSKQEREALGEAVSTILKTKTGRELAAQFVKERACAEVTMGTIENSATVEKAGKKILSGTSGSTDTEVDPPKVTLNRVYLETDLEYRRVMIAGTLAHELFGHAFEEQRAKKAGFPHAALYHYRGDELGSRLIDWLVQTELTGKVGDDNPAEYLDDPEGYYRGLLTADAYYIVSLSPKEMRNPLTTLKGRRKLLAADEASTAADIKEGDAWAPVIAHFVTVHRIAKARFAMAEEELNVSLSWSKRHQKKLAGIKEALEDRIKEWSSPKGAKEKKEVIAAAGAPYLSRHEASLAERARELRRLRADPLHGRDPASVPEITLPPIVVMAPKAPGGPPIDLEELGRMRAEDKKKNPGHWK